MRFSNFVQDLRYSLRTLRRDATFAAFTVCIAGLGIGASTTVFTVVNALLLRPLPFADADRLVWITNHDSSGLSGQTTQVGHMLDLRERTHTLSAIAGYMAFYGVGDALLSGHGEPERVSGVPVSDNFFEILGIRPALGRTFTAEEYRWQGPKAVLLSHALWQRRFASDPRIVGTVLTINDEAHTVVGVLPQSFDFAAVFAPGAHFDLYFPFPLSPETNRWGNTMAMIGRLKPGVTAAQAQADTRAIATELTREHTDRNTFEGFVTPLADHVNGRMRLALWVLASAVAIVMLIVCANVSSLLLARSAARRKDIAIRMALGAGRRRLVAQVFTESIVLSCMGALMGVAVAIVGTRTLAHLDAVSIPLLTEVHTDPTALAFTLALAIGAGILFGLAPAISAPERDLHETLKDASRGSSAGRTWMRSALVVSEIVFASVLLVAAGLLLRSFLRVLDVDLGFRAAHTVTMRVDPDASHDTREKKLAYIDEVLRRARAVAGVDGAGITDALPLGKNRTWGVRAKGVSYDRGRFVSAFVRVVSDGYPAAMSIPIKAGRDISEFDTPTSEPVIVINETMARTMWPGQDPIGKVVLNACAPERTVIGVVGDVRHLALEQRSGNEMYIPLRQCDDLSSTDLVVRSSTGTEALVTALRQTLAPIAPDLAGNTVRTIQELVDRSVSPRRFVVLILAAFAGFALVLASLGIYGLISYSVSQRRQEIGIRMALGASARRVRARIIGETLRLAITGVSLGIVASWVVARALGGLLFGVAATDPVTFASMMAMLIAIALLAGYLPARRASRMDPLAALRAE
ncbi:MAG TPA: ABC transporter permease [Vicinamibacterales bacterium]|nr:ABC transporter permease [Vicinamibacterales bacterium]